MKPSCTILCSGFTRKVFSFSGEVNSGFTAAVPLVQFVTSDSGSSCCLKLWFLSMIFGILQAPEAWRGHLVATVEGLGLSLERPPHFNFALFLWMKLHYKGSSCFENHWFQKYTVLKKTILLPLWTPWVIFSFLTSSPFSFPVSLCWLRCEVNKSPSKIPAATKLKLCVSPMSFPLLQ